MSAPASDRTAGLSAESTIRFPDATSPRVMTRRAIWLVALNILIPGTAQLLAGNRRLGRFGVATTFALWVAAALVAVTFFTAPTVIYTVATNAIGLTVVQIVLFGYAVLWLILTLNTLRLARLARAFPRARVVLAVISVAVMVLTVGSAGYGAYVAGIGRGTIAHVFAGADVVPPVNGRYNIMLLGGDAGPDRLGMRPDSISILSVDATTGSATLIGIPRNLEQVPFVPGSPLYGPYPKGYNCGNDCLISFLYTYGQEHPKLYPSAGAHASQPGVEAMRDVVEGVTGITIQYYALIDMQGFADLIDALGGITIDVKTRLPLNGDLDKAGNPIHVTEWIEPGVQHMDGHTALWYSRVRHGSSDYARMARQREVQQALLAQFKPAVVLSKFEAVASAGSQIVKTDIPSSMLGYFVNLASKARTLPIATLEIVPPTIVTAHPDIALIKRLVAAAIAPAKASPTPSAG